MTVRGKSIYVLAIVRADGTIESRLGNISVTRSSVGVYDIDYSSLQCCVLPTIIINVYGKEVKYDVDNINLKSCTIYTQQNGIASADFITIGDSYVPTDLPFKIFIQRE